MSKAASARLAVRAKPCFAWLINDYGYRLHWQPGKFTFLYENAVIAVVPETCSYGSRARLGVGPLEWYAQEKPLYDIEQLVWARNPGLTQIEPDGQAYFTFGRAAHALRECADDVLHGDLSVLDHLPSTAGIHRPRGPVSVLVKRLREGEFARRDNALAAFVTLQAAEAVPAIAEATDDADPSIRKHAVQALGELAGASGVPDLIRKLKDRSADVRWAAAKALDQIGDPRAVEPIGRLAQRRDDQRNRPGSANWVLEVIDRLAPGGRSEVGNLPHQ